MSDIGAQDRMREAARWFAARRRGMMTVDERALYETWVSDANNLSAMARLERSWTALGVAEDRMQGAGRAPSPPAALASGAVRAVGGDVRGVARDRHPVLCRRHRLLDHPQLDGSLIAVDVVRR